MLKLPPFFPSHAFCIEHSKWLFHGVVEPVPRHQRSSASVTIVPISSLDIVPRHLLNLMAAGLNSSFTTKVSDSLKQPKGNGPRVLRFERPMSPFGSLVTPRCTPYLAEDVLFGPDLPEAFLHHSCSSRPPVSRPISGSCKVTTFTPRPSISRLHSAQASASTALVPSSTTNVLNPSATASSAVYLTQ